MTTLSVGGLGALGIVSCLALILVAAQLAIRWQRLLVLCIAAQGLVLQCAFWATVVRVLRHFDVASSYMPFYLAIFSSAAGTAWAFVLLVITLLGRGLPRG